MAVTKIGMTLKIFHDLKESCFSIFRNYYFKNIIGSTNGLFEIKKNVEIKYASKIKIGNNVFVGPNTILNGRTDNQEYGIVMGNSTYIKGNSYIDAYGGYVLFNGDCNISQYSLLAGQGGIEIGKNVIFGSHCILLSSDHIFNDLELPYMFQGDVKKKILIENNVWIGAGTVILAGTCIGRNCVIGAGSIVNKDVPSNSLFVNKISPRVVRELNKLKVHNEKE